MNAGSAILTADKSHLWHRVQETTSESPDSLVTLVADYLDTLAVSQHDTYTDPFEAVAPNFGNCLVSISIKCYWNNVCLIFLNYV